jgi:hypothetical protein
MLVSAFGFEDILGKDHVSLDPSRIAAQVVSGIGFLGAGAVLKLGTSILILVETLEHRLFPAERIKTISLFFSSPSVDTKKVLRITSGYGIKVQTVNVIQELRRERVQVNLLVNSRSPSASRSSTKISERSPTSTKSRWTRTFRIWCSLYCSCRPAP